MKIHILSDLHLEFAAFEPIIVDADVVVLAGDIGKASTCIKQTRAFWPNKEIVFVPGNHEFYRFDRQEALEMMRIDATEKGVRLLDNDEVVIGGVRFLGATLWTDFELFGKRKGVQAKLKGTSYLSDFREIRDDGKRFTPERSIELHRESLAWLIEKLAQSFDGKTVVVTHHLPSKLSVAKHYKSSLLSACFASDLDLFGKMDLWVHGHTHDSFDYIHKGTRVICNPRGYVSYNSPENSNFDPDLVVGI